MSCTGEVTRRQLDAVAAGAVVEGVMVVPVAVAPVVDRPGDRSRLRVVIAEGRKHEARALLVSKGQEIKRSYRALLSCTRWQLVLTLLGSKLCRWQLNMLSSAG